MKELPQGWEWTTIGEVADIQLGRQRSPRNHQGPHMRPYLRSANITWQGIDTTDVKEMNFEPDEASIFELQPGDLLLNEASGSPNEVGKPAIWRGEIEGCCFQNTLLRVRPRQVSTEYLYWYCRAAALSGRFGEAGRGVNIRHLGKQGLATFPLALPPRAEQERIVAAIEEHISRLDAAIGAAASAQRRLSGFYDAVLHATFDPHWPREPLDALNDPERPICYGILKPRTSEAGTVPYVEVRSIAGGRIKVEELRMTTLALHQEFRRSELRAGDVTLAIRGSVDRAAVVPETLNGANVSRDVARIAPAERLLPDFLAVFLVSPEARRFFQAHARGVAVQGINIGDLRRLPVPVPPISVQIEALRRVEEARFGMSRIDGEVATAQRRGSKLRRSILAAAFSGRLVPQDPDDEPASVLLERIRAERVAATPAKRTRKAKVS